MHYGVGHTCSLELTLMWLLHRAEATAPIGPLALEPPYTTGAVLKSQKKKIFFDKGGKNIKCEKVSHFNKWCWENWAAAWKSMKQEHTLTLSTKNKHKMA